MAQEKKTPAVELKGVTRILEHEVVPVTLVKDIDLVVPRGEFLGIVGPSGSGKSSLMYLLGLLDRPTKGSVWLDGVETQTADEETREQIRLEKIGFIFQFHFLLAEFSALDNIMLPMRKLGRLGPGEMKDRAEKLLDHFGLKECGHKKPYQLSGGERQRVAVARALANEPLLLLADEPTGNLDTKNADLIFSLFEQMVADGGKTVITITHDPDLAARTHRQVYLLDGKLQEK